MERNEATAKHVAWPSSAWLQLSFFPFPVGNPMSAGCSSLGYKTILHTDLEENPWTSSISTFLFSRIHHVSPFPIKFSNIQSSVWVMLCMHARSTYGSDFVAI